MKENKISNLEDPVGDADGDSAVVVFLMTLSPFRVIYISTRH